MVMAEDFFGQLSSISKNYKQGEVFMAGGMANNYLYY